MSCAALVLVPAALVLEKPWRLCPHAGALAAALALSIFCTGVALLVSFRLVRTLGPLGVASQSYLRAVIGVILGQVFLTERLSGAVAIGLAAAVLGVALMNWPMRTEARDRAAALRTR